MTFSYHLTTQGADSHVEMTGHLDERAQMPDVTRIGTGTLTLDLAGVRLINSLGCRRWVNWISAVTAHADQVHLARCSFAVVQQLNLLQDFRPERTRVTSFFVPYKCARWGHGARVLHEVGADFHVGAVPDTLTCAACDGAMTLEVLRQVYFRFLGARAA